MNYGLEQAEEKLAILAAELRTERNERAKAEALCRVQAARIDLLQAALRGVREIKPHLDPPVPASWVDGLPHLPDAGAGERP